MGVPGPNSGLKFHGFEQVLHMNAVQNIQAGRCLIHNTSQLTGHDYHTCSTNTYLSRRIKEGEQQFIIIVLSRITCRRLGRACPSTIAGQYEFQLRTRTAMSEYKTIFANKCTVY